MHLLSTRALAPLILANLLATAAYASHLRGGEIHYTHVSGYTYQFDVHLYSDLILSTTVPIELGDGSTALLTLAQVDTIGSYCAAYRHIYSGTHTYAGPGSYILHVEMVSRSADVLNINMPATQPLCFTAQLVIDPLSGPNNSAVFSTFQTDSYYVGTVLQHALGASDPDGDSLSFAFATPGGTGCVALFPYYLPHDFDPSPDFSWIDPATGLFTWDHPYILGTFVIAIQCIERRNGFVVGRITRDMLLCVNATTVIDEPGTTNGLQVMPTMDKGVVDVLTPFPTGTQLEVVDAEGRLVARSVISGPRTRVQLGALPGGLYVARVTASDGSAAHARFVLER